MTTSLLRLHLLLSDDDDLRHWTDSKQSERVTGSAAQRQRSLILTAAACSAHLRSPCRSGDREAAAQSHVRTEARVERRAPRTARWSVRAPCGCTSACPARRTSTDTQQPFGALPVNGRPVVTSSWALRQLCWCFFFPTSECLRSFYRLLCNVTTSFTRLGHKLELHTLLQPSTKPHPQALHPFKIRALLPPTCLFTAVMIFWLLNIFRENASETEGVFERLVKTSDSL